MKDLLQKDIEKLIRFHSIASRPKELMACAKWIKKQLETQLVGHNVRIEIVTRKQTPSVLAVRGKWKHPDVLLNGHIDVVPGKPEQFLPVTKGDRIYGRGAADMKAGCASLMHAFVAAVKQRPDLSIGLMLTGDEEVASPDGAKYLVESQGWKTKLLVNFDGGYGEEISHAEKGVMRVIFYSKGKVSPAQRPWQGKCALADIIKAYHVLEEMFPDKTKATDTNNWVSTFTPKIINTSPNGNCVIDAAEFYISIHYTEDKSPEQIVDELREKLPQLKIVCQTSATRVYTDPNDPVLLQFQKRYAKHLGHKPPIRAENGSSDARFFAHMHIPMIITKPKSGHPEMDGEWVSLRSTERLTKALVDFLIQDALRIDKTR